MSWGDPVPIGDKYKRASFYANFSTPVEDTGTVTIGPTYGLRYLAYTEGQSVLIVRGGSPADQFEAIVTSYDPAEGTLVLEQPTLIVGSTFGSANYTINLVGQRGGRIAQGSGPPATNFGRPGDMYIDTVTGDVYVKT
jgi:photosystem II stability/assembly factor-like uncharacterized protein